MNNKKAIGIFDSGVGGLTVAKAVQKKLPAENIIYFGDTVHLPYGNKSEKAIIQYSLNNAEFLVKKGVKIIMAACNTASSVAISSLRREINLPVLSVLEPGANAALESTINNRIGVIGTFRTIKSGAYQQYLEKNGSAQTKIFSRACPLFVPIIEEGFKNNKIIDLIIHEYLDGLVQKKIDTLILGCTHYPLIKKQIMNIFPALQIIDSARAAAMQVDNILEKSNLKKTNQSAGNLEIYVNDKSEVFDNITRKLFPSAEPILIKHTE